jgi:hypothetical protein
VIPGLRRHLAVVVCRVVQGTLPRRLRPWGDAIESEVAEIADDGKALAFALGSVGGLMPRVLAYQILRALHGLTTNHVASEGISETGISKVARRPRTIGIACATGAVLLGLAYMAAAGAPSAYLGINAAALVIGILMIGILDTVGAGRIWSTRYGPGGLLMALSLALLATALLGVRVEGAARWVSLGGLSIQPSLILLPVIIVAFARSRDTLSTIAMVVTAAALALQPDRAMAGMMTAALAALALLRPDRGLLAALAAGVIGFTVSLVRSDLLAAMPYVDQVLYSSFDVHVLAGLAVLGGSFLLILPALTGVRHDPANRHIYVGFGTVWLSAVAAAALGNYPTPVVGYGGSAILGYVLSLAILPMLTRSADVDSVHGDRKNLQSLDPQLRVGLAY